MSNIENCGRETSGTPISDSEFDRTVKAIHYTIKGYDEHALCQVTVSTGVKRVHALGEYDVEYDSTADTIELKVKAESDGYSKAIAKLLDINNEDYELVDDS